MAKRRKTTLTIDEDLLRSVKIAAAREDKPEYVIVEDALRRHLSLDVIDRIRAQSAAQGALTDDEAMALAYSELKAMRAERDQGASTA